MQAQNMSKLAVLQEEQRSSETRLAELRQQLDTQQARLQSQVRCRQKRLPVDLPSVLLLLHPACLHLCMPVLPQVRCRHKSCPSDVAVVLLLLHPRCCDSATGASAVSAAAVGSSAGKHTIQWSNVARLVQIDGVTLQQEEQQQQQQIRQQALSALQASIEEELRPQRQQLREQALAAMESEVTNSLQVRAQLGQYENMSAGISTNVNMNTPRLQMQGSDARRAKENRWRMMQSVTCKWTSAKRSRHAESNSRSLPLPCVLPCP